MLVKHSEKVEGLDGCSVNCNITVQIFSCYSENSVDETDLSIAKVLFDLNLGQTWSMEAFLC